MGAVKKTQNTLIGLIPLVVIVIIVAVAFRFFGGFDILTGIAKRAQGFTGDLQKSGDDLLDFGTEERAEAEQERASAEDVRAQAELLRAEAEIIRAEKGASKTKIPKSSSASSKTNKIKAAKARFDANLARGRAGRKLFEESKRKGNTVTIDGKTFSTRFLSANQIRTQLANAKRARKVSKIRRIPISTRTMRSRRSRAAASARSSKASQIRRASKSTSLAAAKQRQIDARKRIKSQRTRSQSRRRR